MKRIHMHWTGGTGKASASDRKHYHFITQADCSTVSGDLQPEANLSTSDGQYVAHTRKANTAAIGVALAAMHGAIERPFQPGNHPVKEKQLAAFIAMVADLCDVYGIPVTRKTVLTHSEIQPSLGIRQNGKWDINWLPGMSEPGDPVAVGDVLREMVRNKMARNQDAPTVPDAVAELIDDADDKGSKSIFATVAQGGTAAIAATLTALGQLDPMIAMMVIGSVTILGSVYLYTSRRGKGRKARAAREALG